METVDNKPQESVPAPAPAPAAKAPEAAPVPAPAPAAVAAPAATPAPAPAPVEIVKGIVPTTKANVAGGWNRFAGYKPGEAKNKKNERRDGPRGRR